ncbi:RNA polymerase sigma-70 factor [Euzebyella saccharophila]|uniref:RNA polymerase sigma-70 factor n=2 Tax=Euzebyella saccharophila TaxID=679664 RepID=A0ABV8JU25_9FLAO
MGNEDDFNTMYAFFKPKLFTITHSYIGNKEDAEEIVHDVLIKLWEKREKLRVTSNFTGYVYRMTRNACLDYLRSKKNRLSKESTSDQQEHWLNYSALSDDASSQIIYQELQSVVERAIKHLPEKCKNVFVKSRMEGMAHKEISEQMEISPKTVENHISRALRELKQVLKEYLPILFL